MRCVDSCLDADEWLRCRDGGRDDEPEGIEDTSLTIGCNGTGADGLRSVTGGPG